MRRADVESSQGKYNHRVMYSGSRSAQGTQNVGQPNSNKSKSTNRQKPKKRK